MQIWWSEYVQPVIINKTQLIQPISMVVVVTFIFIASLIPVVSISQSHAFVFVLLIVTLVWYLKSLVNDEYGYINVSENGVYLHQVNSEIQQNQPIQLLIIACWQLPWVLFVKFKQHNASKVLYLCFSRNKIGAENYSMLIATFVQQNQQESCHE
ncbi:hypothetical protein OS175_11270 [Marinicella sp. S1101]|uniref:hypothetical protein n=1 Tax=Marinicella marina TaxID=2996016 RepID=UPI002260B01B|nr:hypothetical protein [Marinicella marina]MCX7554464.1 hypothetical protein [Marinicella marina]MDJ1140615.1 hypothetical protein [Marinicella marina]